MKLRITSRFAMLIALALIAVIGVLLVLVATPEGAGLSDDSIAYIAGARSLAAGHGYREAWLASNQPVTGLSIVLAWMIGKRKAAKAVEQAEAVGA